jgi:phage terminase large subunit-like protein
VDWIFIRELPHKKATGKMTLAEQYARDIDEGRIIAGKQIKRAANRFLADLERTDIFWDEDEANKIVVFAERYCRLWEDKWAGQPVKIEPWMAFVLQQIYGWFKKPKESEEEIQAAYQIYLSTHEDNEDLLSYHEFYLSKCLRRIQKVFVEVAKKNAKSTLAGVLSLYHLFADTRVNTPKIFVGANNEEQAKICVNIAGKIIEQSPDLAEFVEEKTVDLNRYGADIIRVIHHGRNGFMKAMSKETGDKTSKQSGGKHGINPSLWIIDEYGLADSDALLNTFETAQAGRSEPLGFAITTAGHNKNGPCFTKLRDVGIKVNDGLIIDDSFLAFIYEMDEEDDIQNEANWIKCNPSLGVTVQRDFLRKMLDQAVRDGGSQLVDVTTFNFNKWCDAPVVWLASEVWAKNHHGLKYEFLHKKLCYGGLDLGRTVDLNAFALWFPNLDNSLHGLRAWFWIPEAKIEKNKDHVDYQRWVNEHYIKKTPGNVADYKQIAADIKEIIQEYDFQSLAYDKFLMGHGVLSDLLEEGIQCHEISQNIVTLNMPTKEFERLATDGKIEHFNNPVLAWMIANTIMATDSSGNQKPDKSHSEKKIDGVSASINALAEYKTFEGKALDLTFTSV